jgi:[ribosomal protein S5]-alanine N-acetyltransferase
MDIAAFLPVQSRRLSISAFVVGDWEAYHEIQTSQAHHRYNSETFSPKSETENRRFIEELSASPWLPDSSRYVFAMHSCDDNHLVGVLGLKNGELVRGGSIEVYYSIHQKDWNRGYATEAVRAIARFGFEEVGLHRITAGCDVDNDASRRVLEKAGFRFEGRLRKDRMRQGRWTDGLLFAILEEDLGTSSSS